MTLTESIVVKISHDLAGGIGAVSSTAELMEIDHSFLNEAPALLKQSTSMLMARLRFYRALFGAETKGISNQLLEDYLKTIAPKILFSGHITNRLQLSLVAVGILLLGQGGKIKLTKNELFLEGKEVFGRPEFREILQGKEKNIAPENVEFFWLLEQIKNNQKKLKCDFNTSLAKLSLSD